MHTHVYTLKKEIEIQSIAIFSGETTSLKIRPWSGEEKSFFSSRPQSLVQMITEAKGRLFSYCPKNQPPIFIPAHLDAVVDTSRRTTVLGNTIQMDPTQAQNTFCIPMVEHLLAALEAEGVVDVIIEVTGEVPMRDGSALPWCKDLKDAKTPISIERPQLPVICPQIHGNIEFFHPSPKGSLYIFIPSDEESLRLSTLIDFPSEPLIQSQAQSITQDESFTSTFFDEIAPARTFCSKSDLQLLQEMGLIKGGGVDNGLIYEESMVLSPGGLRFENEMARHKLLDMIGDFSLFPFALKGHVIAIKPSHAGNIAFGRHLLQIKKQT